MDINVRIAGEAGQGVQSAGALLVGALGRMGLNVLSTKSYMSRIRGGLNWFDIRISDRELFAGARKADLLIALSDDALEILRSEVAEGGVIVSSGGGDGALGIDFGSAAAEAGGTKIMANTVAGGAVFALLGYDVERLCEYLATQFAGKGKEAIERNVACARKGAELGGAHTVGLQAPSPNGAPPTLFSGAEAIGLSACHAGLKFATAYPMTPSTATFTYLAGVADKFGLVVEQAEDEIAAINMVCGAAYAGVIAMTMTSGGGFALMVEGVSLGGMMVLILQSIDWVIILIFLMIPMMWSL